MFGCIVGVVSYPNQKVRLTWDDISGVVLNPELKLLQYDLGQPLGLSSSNGYMPEKHGNFSRLTVNFRFERQIGHHLIQTFAPSMLVVRRFSAFPLHYSFLVFVCSDHNHFRLQVMLSWFSFWLGLDAIPGRVTL